MPSFEQGDVVRVPFPYTNRETQQRRPALVVSDGAVANGLLAWVLMITSADNRPWPGDVDIGADLSLSGLPAASIVRTAKIATIEASVAEPIGRLSPKTLAQVLAQVRAQLALP
jgi:mRNA interferase MazF